MTGPTMLAIEKTEAMLPVQMARLCSGMMVVSRVNPPAKIPEAPKPATARPTIRALEFGASAQTRLPTSNTKIYTKYTSFFGNKVYVFPASGWLAHLIAVIAVSWKKRSLLAYRGGYLHSKHE